MAGRRLTGWIVVDLDATIITSASGKAGDGGHFSRRLSDSIRWTRGEASAGNRDAPQAR
ncbi:hypothetical protein [Streptomyces osmaniensis]|uniref:hypothetical protein n=1 Tax=Streptomyces osmaniensis TaxID=593134 RepID=UPI0031FC5E92